MFFNSQFSMKPTAFERKIGGKVLEIEMVCISQNKLLFAYQPISSDVWNLSEKTILKQQ